MKTAVAELQSVGPISFSRRYDNEVPHLEGESHAAYEERTWREKCHYDRKTLECYIPGINIKKAVDWTASQVGRKIKGRGNKTWASIFQSGIICPDSIPLGVKRDKVDSIGLYCNSKGQRNGPLDVWRIFPIVHEWSGTITFYILNDMIDEAIFREHLTKAGQFCGLCRYAPRNGGTNGRFAVKDILWHDEAGPKVA